MITCHKRELSQVGKDGRIRISQWSDFQCDHCDEPFTKRHSERLLAAKFQFCSKKCTYASMKRGGKARAVIDQSCSVHNAPIVLRKCSQCGVEFFNKQYSKYSPNKDYFCSKKCTYDAQGKNGVTYVLRRQKSLEKHGTFHPMQTEAIIKKRRNTVRERFGIDCVFQTARVLEIQRRPDILHRRLSKLVGMPYDVWQTMRSEYEIYESRVRVLTSKVDVSHLQHSEQRSLYGYHLDHKVSIFDGFRHGLPPEILASEHNLEFIPAKSNWVKNRMSTMSINELVQAFSGSQE